MNRQCNQTHETIDFEDIRNFDKRIFDLETFELYLNELFLELSINGKSQPDIPKINFIRYLANVPLFISEKIFNSFNASKTGYLSLEEFCNNIQILKNGKFEDVAKIVFNIYDFDGDGIVSTKDIKLLISHLPLKSQQSSSIDYKFQMESLQDLKELIRKTFGTENFVLDFNTFLKVIENNRADIFLQILCYLFLSIPVFEKAMELYKIKRNKKSSVHYSPTFKLHKKLIGVGEPMIIDDDDNTNKKYSGKQFIRANNDDSIIISKCKKLIVSDNVFSPIAMLKFRKSQNKTFKTKMKTPIKIKTPSTAKVGHNSPDKLNKSPTNTFNVSDLKKKKEFLNQFGSKTDRSPEKIKLINKNDVINQNIYIQSPTKNIANSPQKQNKLPIVDLSQSPFKKNKDDYNRDKDLLRSPDIGKRTPKDMRYNSPLKNQKMDIEQCIIIEPKTDVINQQRTLKIIKNRIYPLEVKNSYNSPEKESKNHLNKVLSKEEKNQLQDVINFQRKPSKNDSDSFENKHNTNRSPQKEKQNNNYIDFNTSSSINNSFFKEQRHTIETGSPTKKFFLQDSNSQMNIESNY